MSSLRKARHIFYLILIVVSALANSPDTYDGKALPLDNVNQNDKQLADSIMRLFISKATRHKEVLSTYEAEIYTKGRTEILKQNILIHFAHLLYPVDRKNKDMFFELVSHSKYIAPNSYLHDFKAVNGNSIPNSKKQQEVLGFLNLNVYAPMAYDDAIIMPTAHSAFKHYSFSLDSVEKIDGLIIYKIRFTPNQLSQKLVCGNLYITDKLWTIDKIDMSGRYSFAEFNLVMSFNRALYQFTLPEKADLLLRYKTLGNVVETNYHSSFKHQKITWIEEGGENRSLKSFDLTHYYQLSADTVPIIQDSTYWKSKRDIPLTQEEAHLYNQAVKGNISKIDTAANMQPYVKLTQQLTNNINMDFKSTRIKYSGILNPFQLGYSGRNGITYKQRFRLSKTFSKDRQFRFYPEAGYVFKRKQLFVKIGADWEYLPQRRGAISLLAGNDNESYAAEITKVINEQLKDSTFNFEDLNLEYFKHFYLELKNSIELFNGFQLTTSLSYHRRVPVKKQADIDPGDEVEDLIKQNFDDFTPVIGITYTPRQYYRMDGYRKEYVYSRYPTISLEFARGIPGVGNSSGDYFRMEADIHQSITLGLSRRLNYHISGGLYTLQRSTYFADFRYFARRNFPDSWDNQIGGVFNLLKGEWFNAADQYVQAHFMYESPFVLFRVLRAKSPRYMQAASRYIFSERLYFSQLWTPVLPSYTEVGYGVGNHIFNIALFAGFDRWKYQGIGIKFAFELFK